MKKERTAVVFVAYSPVDFRRNFMKKIERFKIVHNPNNRQDGFIGAIADDKFYLYYVTIVFWGMSDVLYGSITPCEGGFLLSSRFRKTFYTVVVNLVAAAMFTGIFTQLLFLAGLGVWPPCTPFAVAVSAVVTGWFFVFWKPNHYKKLFWEELGELCGGKLLEQGKEAEGHE